jgi:hypothetical protein
MVGIGFFNDCTLGKAIVGAYPCPRHAGVLNEKDLNWRRIALKDALALRQQRAPIDRIDRLEFDIEQLKAHARS